MTDIRTFSAATGAVEPSWLHSPIQQGAVLLLGLDSAADAEHVAIGMAKDGHPDAFVALFVPLLLKCGGVCAAAPACAP